MAEHKIAERDMLRLVEEVSKLDSERQQMLDKSQVAKILDDLNLPSDLLNEALERLEYKKARERRQKAFKLNSTVVAIAAVAIGIAYGYINATQVHQYDKISASDARITISADSAEALASVKPGGTIFVHTVLHNVPVHKQLPLHAKWFTPDGNLFHENDWQTRDTTSSTWDTHAKVVIPDGAPSGKWMVQISVAGREVISKIFNVD